MKNTGCARQYLKYTNKTIYVLMLSVDYDNVLLG